MIKACFYIFIILAIVAGTGIFFYLSFSIEPQDIINQADSDMTLEDLSGFDRVGDAEFTMIDLIHKGSGQAAVYEQDQKSILRFENFNVTNGPDLYVYLSKERNLEGLRPDIGDFVSLGKLKSPIGDQTYLLPENYEDYPSVLIWCRAFGVLFSVAEIFDEAPTETLLEE